MTETSLSKIAEKLKSANSVLIFAHKDPDGDAIGSMIAAGLALKALGKRVDYRAGKDKRGFDVMLPEMSHFNAAPASSYDIALVVDCSTKEYMYDGDMLPACKESILIDHHDTNTRYADYCHVEEDSAATGEIIFNLIAELGVELTKEMADAVFISLVTDTGNFTFSNTTARTHSIISQLYASFGGFYLIAEFIRTVDVQTVEILKIGLENTDTLAEGKMKVAHLLYEQGYSTEAGGDTETLTNTIRYINGVELAVLIRQISADSFKISMRSSSENIDVSSIAASFGGGGHTKAAGFNFTGKIAELDAYFADLAEKIF